MRTILLDESLFTDNQRGEIRMAISDHAPAGAHVPFGKRLTTLQFAALLRYMEAHVQAMLMHDWLRRYDDSQDALKILKGLMDGQA